MNTSAIGLKLLRTFVRSGSWTYKVRQGVAAGMIRKGGMGFLPKPLSSEEKFLPDLDWEGQTFSGVEVKRLAGTARQRLFPAPHRIRYAD